MLTVGAGTVVVVAAVVDVVGATVVVVVVVVLVVDEVDDVAGATDVVGDDVDGVNVFVTHTAAPAPPEHVCHPALDVQCEFPYIGALGYREGPTLENTGVERVQSTIHNSAGPLNEVMPEVRRDVVMY